MTITPRNAAKFARAEKAGKYIKLRGATAVGLERLKEAYGMETRLQVIEYLIEQGVKGLEAAQCGADVLVDQNQAVARLEFISASFPAIGSRQADEALAGVQQDLYEQVQVEAQR